jgi:hypothetical protein
MHPASPVLFLFSVAIVLVLIRAANDPLLVSIAGLNAVVALLGVIRSTVGGLRPVGAAFFIFWFSWLGIGSIAQITLEQVAWGDFSIFYDRGRLLTALTMTLVSITALLGGEAFSRRRAERRPIFIRPAQASNHVRGWVLAGIAAALLVIGANAIRTLGFGTYFTSRAGRSAVLEEQGLDLAAVGGAQFALITALPVALSISGALLSFYRVRASWPDKGTLTEKVGGLKVLDIACCAYFFAAICIFANPISQNRFTALTAFGSLAIAVLVPRSRKAAAVFTALGLIATLIIYPIANYFRGNRETDFSVDAETFTTNDFDGFQMVVNTITYVHDVGLGWGTHILSALGYFIPRSLWQGKEVPASLDVASHASYSFTNLSMPVHMEFYLEFGWVGLIGGMFLVGYFIGQLDAAWQSRGASKLFYFVPYAAMVALGFIRGPLGSQVPVYLTVMVILYLAIRKQAGPETGETPHTVGVGRFKGSAVRTEPAGLQQASSAASPFQPLRSTCPRQ